MQILIFALCQDNFPTICPPWPGQRKRYSCLSDHHGLAKTPPPQDRTLKGSNYIKRDILHNWCPRRYILLIFPSREKKLEKSLRNIQQQLQSPVRRGWRGVEPPDLKFELYPKRLNFECISRWRNKGKKVTFFPFVPFTVSPSVFSYRRCRSWS